MDISQAQQLIESIKTLNINLNSTGDKLCNLCGEPVNTVVRIGNMIDNSLCKECADDAIESVLSAEMWD